MTVHSFLVLLLFHVLVFSVAQQIDDCPRDWWPWSGQCYHFVESDTTVQEAVVYCQQKHSALVSVNSEGEHRWLNQWLFKQDGERREWLTSGFRNQHGGVVWTGDNSVVSPNRTNFFPEAEEFYSRRTDPSNDLPLNRIVYRFHVERQEYLWAWQRIMVPRPFVCEISKRDVWKIYQQRRDFSFGTGITDPNKWLMGPKITSDMQDTVFFEDGGRMTPVVLGCEASGNPAPSYRWFMRRTDTGVLEQLQPGGRFTLTNGRLVIDPPDRTLDVTEFTCEASNEYGVVRASPVTLTYGVLAEFNNVPPSPTQAVQYKGVVMECKPPAASPAVSYNWFRDDVTSFIRPELNAQYFLSMSGAFYISETHFADSGTYYCTAFLKPGSGRTLASFQTKSVMSTKMELRVRGSNPLAYGPEINDLFPQHFPELPFIGDTVIIECLAYGRLPLTYRWYREDGPMNPRAKTSNHGRVLTIPDAGLQDTGMYSCVVKGVATRNKTMTLIMNAVPQFPYGLDDQHVDLGQPLTWVCNVIAVPRATFKWFKDAVELKTDVATGIEVTGNVLRIAAVEAATHEGMYTCQATNDHGVRRASGQLRTVAFAPTFAQTPVDPSKQAAVGGNVTVKCRPQAAPRATIRWTRRGQDAGRVLPNGDLLLTDVTMADSGTYTCTATNNLGEASDELYLEVVAGTVFSTQPVDEEIIVGGNLQLPCEASFDPTKSDIVYSWMFNDHRLDFSIDSKDGRHYAMPYSQGFARTGMLYIKSTGFEQQGFYTCVVSTVTGMSSERAYVTVKGPPGEPLGVHAANNTEDQRESVELWWQPGAHRGFPVTKYTIEAKSEFAVNETDYKKVAEDIRDADLMIASKPEWRSYRVTSGLSPGTAYNFRVYAGNDQMGYGPPSRPSPMVKMYDAAPVVAPDMVGGGGGSVGMLNISWNHLPREDWGASKLWYNVYFRQFFPNEARQSSQQWSRSEYKVFINNYQKVVGADLYYTPYQVKVQAENIIGAGPNSSIVKIFSAEDIPTLQPTEITAEAENGTAGIVTWVLKPRNRDKIRGTVYAFQINYWSDGDTRCPGTNEWQSRFVRCYGDITECLVIGMEPGSDYCVNLQFLNKAGLGPKTDNYYFGMNDAAPGDFPTEVTIMSHGPDSVRVYFRGVSTRYSEKWEHIEDPLAGYKAWWWEINEDIRSAQDHEVDFKRLETGVIHGIKKNTIYKLRVLPYNGGGYGKKSSDLYFTLGGQVLQDPTTTLFRNAAITGSSSHVLFLVSLLLTILNFRNNLQTLL